MQVSNDVRMVLPLLVAIIIAKWIADAVSHSLYHAILEVKCVPILHGSPQSRVNLDLIPVHHVMAYPVVIFQEQMPLTTVREILRDTRHNGFPVVRNTPQGQVGARDHACSMMSCQPAIRLLPCEHRNEFCYMSAVQSIQKTCQLTLLILPLDACDNLLQLCPQLP